VTSAPVPLPPATTEIRVKAIPAQAHFALDGVPVGGNPATLQVPRDHTPHVLRAEADGFTAEERTVFPDRDLDLQITLAASARPVGRASAPATPTPTVKRGPKALDTSDPWGNR
jgi:serine/threonine-protein kinase